VYATSNGKGGIELVDHLQTSGRYVRMNATKSYWGSYSLWEMEIVSPQMPCAHTVPTLPSGSARGAIKIYPNPAHAQLTIDWSNINSQNKTAAIQICAMNGSLLRQLYTPQYLLAVNCGQWARGSYLVKVLLDVKIYHETFIKV
jgi:Secretion system C-terminal sorting domain